MAGNPRDVNNKEGLQSGDDSGLQTIWDELCVQAQVEYSVVWDAYEDTMMVIIEAEIDQQKVEPRGFESDQTDNHSFE